MFDFGVIKTEARRRIALSPLVEGCKKGDTNFVRALMVIFWEFVDDFPSILYKRFSEIDDPIIRRSAKKLAGIAEDEKSHRNMWLTTAAEVGLSYKMLTDFRGVFPWVTSISRHMGEDVGVRTLLRIVGVEVVAEMLSTELLNAPLFDAALTESGRTWFKVHVVHAGTTHEQIALSLAMRELEKTGADVEEIVRDEVLAVVDMFVKAAEGAPDVAESFE